MANEKRLIDANDLWSDVMMLPHNGDVISSEEVEQAIKDAQTVDAMELPKGRPGDYMEWSNGVSTRFFEISAICICKDSVRYDIGFLCPVINHKNIIRILTPEEMEREMKNAKID